MCRRKGWSQNNGSRFGNFAGLGFCCGGMRRSTTGQKSIAAFGICISRTDPDARLEDDDDTPFASRRMCIDPLSARFPPAEDPPTVRSSGSAPKSDSACEMIHSKMSSTSSCAAGNMCRGAIRCVHDITTAPVESERYLHHRAPCSGNPPMNAPPWISMCRGLQPSAPCCLDSFVI